MQLEEYKALYQIGEKALADNDINGAVDAFSKCVAGSPGTSAGHLALALTLNNIVKGMEPVCERALYHAQECAKLDGKNITAWAALGEIALHANRWNEAIAAYERAIELEPDKGTLWGMLGFAQARNGDIPAARDSCEKAVELDPELGIAHFLLCCFYYEKFYDAQMLAFHGERAFEAKNPCKMKLEAMWNAAHGFLALGNYPKGFAYFEARLSPNTTNTGNVLALDRHPGKPIWRGQQNARVLVSAEQGLGDVFCMMRYLPMIREQSNCSVIFEVHDSILSLARANYPDIECVKYGEITQEFDYQVPMMSLPLAFGTKRDSVPNEAYIAAQPEKLEEWRGKIKLWKQSPNIGICWHAGRNSWNATNHATSKRKSLTFEQIKPILDMQGFNFISLQVGNDAQFPHPGIKDFSDTAAIISLMDIVITVDTAVANLAGAMGKEFWLLDRFDNDWRWESVPTPWFPSAVIYRQVEPNRWEPAIEKMKMDLQKFRDKLAA